jgi:hypothetical protein
MFADPNDVALARRRVQRRDAADDAAVEDAVARKDASPENASPENASPEGSSPEGSAFLASVLGSAAGGPFPPAGGSTPPAPAPITLPAAGQRAAAGGVDLRLLRGWGGRYVRYNGSLAQPPCTEDVQRIVLLDAQAATAEQLAPFREALAGMGALGNNRDVQPTSGRRVELVDTARFFESLWLRGDEGTMTDVLSGRGSRAETPRAEIEVEPDVIAVVDTPAARADLPADQRRAAEAASARGGTNPAGPNPGRVDEMDATVATDVGSDEETVIAAASGEATQQATADDVATADEARSAEALVAETEGLLAE